LCRSRRVYRIGYLHPGPGAAPGETLRVALRELGYVLVPSLPRTTETRKRITKLARIGVLAGPGDLISPTG
jgi:hypothetical protein